MIRQKLRLDEVCAVVVMDGEEDVDLDNIIFPNKLVWDNSKLYNYKTFARYVPLALPLGDPFVKQPVVYVQDQPVPKDMQYALVDAYVDGKIVANSCSGSPYPSLDGGALFDRALPLWAFKLWQGAGYGVDDEDFLTVGCDVVFATLCDDKRIGDRPDFEPDATEARFHDDALSVLVATL